LVNSGSVHQMITTFVTSGLTDKRCWARIEQYVRARVPAIARRYQLPLQDYDDLAQNVLGDFSAYLLRSLDTGRNPPSDCDAFIHKCIANAAIRMIRLEHSAKRPSQADAGYLKHR